MRLLRSLCSLAMTLFAFLPPLAADPTPQDILHRIEARTSYWTGFQAEVQLDFMTQEPKQASCQGTLAYRRADEKMILRCFDETNRLVFIFKTRDENFELYLPSHAAVYSGNIFDLEFSEGLASHIKPLHLYRALKVNLFKPEEAILEKGRDDRFEFAFQGVYEGVTYLKRRLVANEKGDIVHERYFTPRGKETVAIGRSDFKKFKTSLGKTYFPRKILIEDPADSGAPKTWTYFRFKEISFRPRFDDTTWEMNLPEETKRVPIPR